jgi:anti-sigma factor RsiW
VITCRRLAELLLEYVEKELAAEQSKEVSLHLLDCPCCIAFAESYREVIRLARQLPRVPLPEKLLASLRAAVRGV